MNRPIGINLSDMMRLYDANTVRSRRGGVAWRDGWGPLQAPSLAGKTGMTCNIGRQGAPLGSPPILPRHPYPYGDERPLSHISLA